MSHAEVERLWNAHRAALAAYRSDDSDQNRDAEQRAHDELVDYVEAHGLNYTRWDPRNV